MTTSIQSPDPTVTILYGRDEDDDEPMMLCLHESGFEYELSWDQMNEDQRAGFEAWEAAEEAREEEALSC